MPRSGGGKCCGASAIDNCIEKGWCEAFEGSFSTTEYEYSAAAGMVTKGECWPTKALCKKIGAKWSDPHDACCSKARTNWCKTRALCEEVDGTWLTWSKHLNMWLTKEQTFAAGQQGQETTRSEGRCCGATSLENCVNEDACKAQGFKWDENRKRHRTGGQGSACQPVSLYLETDATCCTSSALNGCLTEFECETAGGKWSRDDPEKVTTQMGCCATGFEAGCHTKAHCEEAKGTWVGYGTKNSAGGKVTQCIQTPLWSSEVAIAAGLASYEGCKGVQLIDIDGDRDQDIILLVGTPNKQGGAWGKQTFEIMRDGVEDARYQHSTRPAQCQ